LKPIEAKDQAGLSMMRCLRLAWSGMSYRMLRSGITTAILALAVAFLVYVLLFGLMAERTQREAWDRLEPTRSAIRDLSRLTSPDPAAEVISALAGDHQTLKIAYRRWAGFDDATWSRLTTLAEAWSATQVWFEQRTATESATLLGGQSLSAWLDAMQTEPARRQFEQRLAALGLAGEWAAHRADHGGDALITDWPRLREAAESIRRGQRQAITALRAQDPRPIVERLAAADDHRDLAAELEQPGFAFGPAELRRLRDYAGHLLVREQIDTRLTDPQTRSVLLRQFGSAEPDAVMRALADGQLTPEALRLDGTVRPGAAAAVARRALRERQLRAVTVGYTPADRDTPFGLPPRTLWLVGLSLLVCVVGVTNALLMSVTERFNEIATMKCLGAMDGSVMRIFVIEALIQGLIGGSLGLVVGVLLAVGRGYLEFGGHFGFAFAGWPDLLRALGLSLGVGVLLATLAAVAPSWVASRLAPMEAMRVE
jgi:putative ABC transport system permease protein